MSKHLTQLHFLNDNNIYLLIQFIITGCSWTISLGIVFKTNILTVCISPVLSKYLCNSGTTSGDDPTIIIQQ